MDFLEFVLLVLVTTILRRYYFLYLIWSLIFCLCGIWNDSFIFDNTIFTIPLTYYRPFQADSSVAVYSNCQCFGHLLWKSCPLGFPLVLLLFVAVLIVRVPFLFGVGAGCGIDCIGSWSLSFNLLWIKYGRGVSTKVRNSSLPPNASFSKPNHRRFRLHLWQGSPDSNKRYDIYPAKKFCTLVGVGDLFKYHTIFIWIADIVF